jgi:hypothetical protein
MCLWHCIKEDGTSIKQKKPPPYMLHGEMAQLNIPRLLTAYIAASMTMAETSALGG